jgi:hypothetical protein
MTIHASVIDALISAGATAEMIAAAVKADIAEDATRLAHKRSVDRERQKRFRAARLSRVTSCEIDTMSRDVTVTSVTAVSSPKESFPHTPFKEITPPSNIPRARANGATPRSELETVLDALHAAAVIDHRQRIRKPLTAHAAKLLAGKFAKCADPNAAADAMIANGWQGFEPEWLENRTHGPRPNGTGPPKPPTGSAKLTALLDTPLEETYDRRRDPKLIASSVRTIRDR